MPTIKKKAKKMDRKLISSLQKWEPRDLARKHKEPVALVRQAIATANKNGKPCRSRWRVEKRLQEIVDALPRRL